MVPGEPNPLLENSRYKKVQTLGKGCFGFVELARDTHTDELVAIKMLKRSDVNKYVEGEIVNHSLLRHPHVIQFKEVFLTSQYICIVMEYAAGGSLFHYVQKQGKLREAVARWFFQQLMIGVEYCHKRGVANRDIKLENTLLQVQHILTTACNCLQGTLFVNAAAVRCKDCSAFCVLPCCIRQCLCLQVSGWHLQHTVDNLQGLCYPLLASCCSELAVAYVTWVGCTRPATQFEKMCHPSVTPDLYHMHVSTPIPMSDINGQHCV